MRPYRKITIKQERFILDNYQDYRCNKELGLLIGLTAQQVRNVYRRHGLRKVDGCGYFKKKHQPWNKGKKIPGALGGETKFKTGQLPHNTVPIGTLRISRDGVFEIKFMNHKWRSLHSHLWIEKYGPIPKSHVVVFKAGVNKQSFNISDLELISRRELVIRNNPKTKKNGVHLH